jgi:tripartite-type tricarboxylate transporter receptor subunit TctC
MRKSLLSILTLFLWLNFASTDRALAQPYPTGTIKLIVPFGAGQTPDVIARVLAQKLSPMLGQEVIVENRPGAGGTIGTLTAAKSAPDGYTLLFASTSALSIAPSLYANLGYDAVKSFAPISFVGTAPFLIVVHPSVARSLRELIELAKARPGQLKYGADTGTPPHIAGEMFKIAAGVDLVHVPYKVAAAGVNDLLSGQVQIMFQQLATLEEHIQRERFGHLRSRARNDIPAFPICDYR